MFVLALALVTSMAQAAPQQTQSQGVAGQWNVSVMTANGSVDASLDLKADPKDASKITGTFRGLEGETAPVTGTFADGKLTSTFSLSGNGSSLKVTLNGALQKNGSLAGTLDFGGGAIAWTATRAEATPAPQPAPAQTIAGKWVLALDIQGTIATPGLDLKVDGEKVAGFYEGRYGKFPVTGTFKGKALNFTFTMNADGAEVVMAFAGEVAADFKSIKGAANMEGLGEVSWSAKRPEK